MIAPEIHDRVRRFGLPPGGLVAAVSGGPDSVALARAVAAVRAPGSPLVLAHLNHLLRGADSDADEAFVAHLHATLHAADPAIGLCASRIDVASLARAEGGNLEAVARRERYRWLAEVARRHGLAHVATGHTADDQAETVLHRLLRGSGLDGLRGIAAARELAPGIRVIRPLLSARRAEVVAYLAELGQAARHDATNNDRTRTRNRIRHELLPLLARDYNPRVVEVLGRLAAQAEEAAAAEEAMAAELLAGAELPRAGTMVILDAGALGRAPRRVACGALRLVWRREGWPLGEMGHEHWQRLAYLAGAEGGGRDLPGGVRALRRGRVLQIQPPD